MTGQSTDLFSDSGDRLRSGILSAGIGEPIGKKLTKAAERYRSDPEFREKTKQAVKEWGKKNRHQSEILRRLLYLRCWLRKIRMGVKNRVQIDAIHAEISQLKPLRKEEVRRRKIAARTGIPAEPVKLPDRIAIPVKVQRPKPPPKPRYRKPPVPDEVRKRNMLYFEANMERMRLKKQAAQEWRDMVASYQSKWYPILGRAKHNRNKKNRRKRSQILRATRKINDGALLKQITSIHHGPCICYWCSKKLPSGGEVDHIIALAKGGTHTSDNICAACPACNSKKSDHHHSELDLLPTLL